MKKLNVVELENEKFFSKTIDIKKSCENYRNTPHNIINDNNLYIKCHDDNTFLVGSDNYLHSNVLYNGIEISSKNSITSSELNEVYIYDNNYIEDSKIYNSNVQRNNYIQHCDIRNSYIGNNCMLNNVIISDSTSIQDNVILESTVECSINICSKNILPSNVYIINRNNHNRYKNIIMHSNCFNNIIQSRINSLTSFFIDIDNLKIYNPITRSTLLIHSINSLYVDKNMNIMKIEISHNNSKIQKIISINITDCKIIKNINEYCDTKTNLLNQLYTIKSDIESILTMCNDENLYKSNRGVISHYMDNINAVSINNSLINNYDIHTFLCPSYLNLRKLFLMNNIYLEKINNIIKNVDMYFNIIRNINK